MHDFRLFLEKTVQEELKETLSRLPKKFLKLIDGYKFKFEHGSNLKGNPGSVGLVHINDKKNKTIKVASSWRHPNEFVALHEVAHLIYEKYILGKKIQKEWETLVKNTKDKKNESAEENFCHAFAATYCKNPPAIHHHDEWIKFIKNL